MLRLKTLTIHTITLVLVTAMLSASGSLMQSGATLDRLVFNASADGYVSAQAPTANFGKLTSLLVNASPRQVTYLRFQVSGLYGRKISSATLLVHANNSSSSALVLQPVGNTWSETTLNYNNAPAITNPAGTPRWSVPSVNAGSWVAFNLDTAIAGEGIFSFALTTPAGSGLILAARESFVYPPRLSLSVLNPSPGPMVTITPTPNADPVLVGAGDIADCGSSGDEATANLLAKIPGTVFTAGDNAYEDGSAAEYANCYNPGWGRFKSRTRPSPGNHEYHTSGALPYFAYFGSKAGSPGKGYYSYNLGTWHIIVLNSEIDSQAGSPQEVWLRQDLAANPQTCTLAIWHKPLFASGASHGNNPEFKDFWLALYQYHADVVLNGHEHNYERFAPQTPEGKSNANGIREFVVGTGGKNHYGFGRIVANSQVRNGDSFGVLKLTLHPGSYDWQFIPEAGKTFTDSGTARCVP
ncbi:MAG TPA: DNRLRE domain-containing protein [Anaerolineales bacterium]